MILADIRIAYRAALDKKKKGLPLTLEETLLLAAQRPDELEELKLCGCGCGQLLESSPDGVICRMNGVPINRDCWDRRFGPALF